VGVKISSSVYMILRISVESLSFILCQFFISQCSGSSSLLCTCAAVYFIPLFTDTNVSAQQSIRNKTTITPADWTLYTLAQGKTMITRKNSCNKDQVVY
jgi:hypothetical protein